MTSLKTLFLVTCLSAPAALLVSAGAYAETPATATDATKTDAVKTDAAKTDAIKAPAKKKSDAELRAKAADCTKQANTKKLAGEARLKFREECKKS